MAGGYARMEPEGKGHKKKKKQTNQEPYRPTPERVRGLKEERLGIRKQRKNEADKDD
ncbi:hypothetical protein [Pseudobutyrivibrio xylanivorans]|uniref:hypothetical protein n=1 Tax=Pseudobutyrivibrio xylanivorans TaxID=185007 RepID=UPI00142EB0F1|nr:hypothetical protein [Pseudobutyrivibrio xylanivorans]